MIKRGVSVILLLGAFFTLASAQTAHAGVAGFITGRIIDDGVFTNSTSMSVADIQNFLNSKVPTCNTNQAGYTGSTGTIYSPPWVCLKDFYENPTTTYTVSFSYLDTSCTTQTGSRTYFYNNAYQYTSLAPVYTNGDCHQGYSLKATIQPIGGAIPSGAISAAQIIYNIAQQYQINPQVLIVLLQKEQGLVTDTWPAPWEYQSATGYGCPDYASCSSGYSGFSNQLKWSAIMFRSILNASPTWYTPYLLGNNYIQYSPDAACGGSTVNIENRSTQALYNYTPYQPNQATLDAGWGTASCGAYGNRNFYLYFTSWFGSVRDVAYQARFNAQSPPQTEPLYFGEPRAVYIEYTNAGYAAWYDDTSVPAGYKPVHLAASNPINRQSAFSYGWPSAGRPAVNFSKVYLEDGVTLAPDQHVVMPGQIARFEFNLTPAWALSAGSYQEYFRPVLENADNWDMGGVAWLDVPVTSRYKAKFVSQSNNTTIKRNSDIVHNTIKLSNSGSAAWYDTTSVPTGYRPIQFAASAPYLRSSQFASSWKSSSIAATVFSKVYLADGVTLAPNQHIVMPGQVGEFSFDMQANEQIPAGVYREYFQPVLANEPNNPFMDMLAWYDVTVQVPTRQATFNTQSAFPSMTLGQSAPVFLQYTNSGTAAWYDDTSVPAGYKPVHLAASNPINRQSAFSYGWPSAGRPAVNFSKVYLEDGVTLAPDQHVVMPGQIARFEFNMTAPWNINYGVHREYFQPVTEWSNNWNLGAFSWLDMTVHQ